MAIVINNTPPTYASAHGDVLFTAYEATKANDPVTYPNYKYVCDVYIGGSMVARLKAFPNPVNKRGIFNIGQIVRNYLAMQFRPTGAGILAQEFGAGVFYTDVTCQFGEEYSFTTYTNILIDSPRRYYSHYNNQLYSGQTVLGSYVNALASNRPYANSLLVSDGNFFVPFFSTSSSISISVTAYPAILFAQGGYILTTDGYLINTTTGDRVLQAGTVINPTLTGSATLSVTAGSLQQLNLSPAAINHDIPGVIDSTIGYYVVTINSTINILFQIACEGIFTPYTLHFMNQIGGFDSMSFRKLSRKNYTQEKKTFLQQPFRMDGSGVIYYSAGGVVNDTVTTYSSLFKKGMTVTTDNLSDGEWSWLKELAFSPLVYLQDGSYLVPVSVSLDGSGNAAYEEMKFVNEKRPRALVLNLDFGITQNAQYR